MPTSVLKTPINSKSKSALATPIAPKKLGKDSEVGALWTKSSQRGEEYMTGDITVNGAKTQIIVFRNGFKEHDKMPDFRIYFREPLETSSNTTDESVSDSL